MFSLRKPYVREQHMEDEHVDPVPAFLIQPRNADHITPTAAQRAAATAAQHMHDLESENNYLKTIVQELRGELATMRAANDILNADMEAYRIRCEIAEGRYRDVKAKLEVAGQIVLGLWDEHNPREEALAEQGVAAVEAELDSH